MKLSVLDVGVADTHIWIWRGQRPSSERVSHAKPMQMHLETTGVCVATYISEPWYWVVLILNVLKCTGLYVHLYVLDVMNSVCTRDSHTLMYTYQAYAKDRRYLQTKFSTLNIIVMLG